MTDLKLKPCPLCGNPPSYVRDSMQDEFVAEIGCQPCHMEVTDLYSLKLAAERWNRRAHESGVHPSSNGLGTPQPATAPSAAKWK